MKKPKTMKLREEVVPQAGKSKRHSRDDINSESRSRVCKKIRERKSSNRRYGSHSAFLGFISHISAKAVHDRVLFLSLSCAHIVNFITRKKFPPSMPGIDDAFFLRKVY